MGRFKAHAVCRVCGRRAEIADEAILRRLMAGWRPKLRCKRCGALHTMEQAAYVLAWDAEHA